MAGWANGWRSLSWNDRRDLMLMMLVGLPSVAAGVRLFGYIATREWLERHSVHAGECEPSPADIKAAQRLARLAKIAGRRGPITATCLRQSLLIYWVLRRRGFAPDLKIGVRKKAGAFDAHAWVELDRIALGQTALVHSPLS